MDPAEPLRQHRYDIKWNIAPLKTPNSVDRPVVRTVAGSGLPRQIVYMPWTVDTQAKTHIPAMKQIAPLIVDQHQCLVS
jgi:hypothetical protein